MGALPSICTTRSPKQSLPSVRPSKITSSMAGSSNNTSTATGNQMRSHDEINIPKVVPPIMITVKTEIMSIKMAPKRRTNVAGRREMRTFSTEINSGMAKQGDEGGVKQASGGDVSRHTERTVGMRNRATWVVPAQSRGPWHAAGNEGRNAAPKRWNATVSTGQGLKKAEKCGGDCPQLRIPRHKNTSF